jgi:homogentisate 1,2-dioxygenase
MVDTFYPLQLTEHAFAIEDQDYYKSWLTDEKASSNGH